MKSLENEGTDRNFDQLKCNNVHSRCFPSRHAGSLASRIVMLDLTGSLSPAFFYRTDYHSFDFLFSVGDRRTFLPTRMRVLYVKGLPAFGALHYTCQPIPPCGFTTSKACQPLVLCTTLANPPRRRGFTTSKACQPLVLCTSLRSSLSFVF